MRSVMSYFFPSLLLFLTISTPILAQTHGGEIAEDVPAWAAFVASLKADPDAEVPFPAEPIDLDAYRAKDDWLELVPRQSTDHDRDLEGLSELPPLEPPHPVFDREPEDAVRPQPQRDTFPFTAFDYDEGTPTVYCVPARICSFELAPGETLRGRALGDPSRWLYQELSAGAGDEERVLVALMPKHFGARTNLILTTDQRIYTVALVSADVDAEDEEAAPALTERARFAYPEAWAEARPAEPRAFKALEAPSSEAEAQAAEAAPLNFHYTVVEPRRRTRRMGWRPIVYDDGTYTFVRLPSSMATLPAVRGIDRNDEPFPLNENYRRTATGHFIEIPRLVNRVELSIGTGRDRRLVTIYRNVRNHE